MSHAGTLAVTAGSFFGKKDYKNALLCFDQSIGLLESEGGDMSAKRRAWIYAHRGETSFRVADNRNQVLSDSELDDLLNNAEKGFLKAIEIDSGYAWAHAHLGELYRYQVNRIGISSQQRQNYFAKGKAAFKKATELDDKYAWAYSHWGAMLANMRTDYAEALDLLRKNLEIRRNTDAWAYANQVVCYYQEKNMSRAFNALFSSISINPHIFTKSIFPAAQITDPMELSFRDQFIWALRNYLDVNHKASLPDEQEGALAGFYQPFIYYFSVIQQVVSWLADEDYSVVENIPDFGEITDWSRKQTREDLYRHAGWHALVYKVGTSREQALVDAAADQGILENYPSLDQVKKKALDLLGQALKGLNTELPRDKELLDLALVDIVWYEMAGDVANCIPDNFKKYLGYGKPKQKGES